MIFYPLQSLFRNQGNCSSLTSIVTIGSGSVIGSGAVEVPPFYAAKILVRRRCEEHATRCGERDTIECR
jgi:hypothetical protein